MITINPEAKRIILIGIEGLEEKDVKQLAKEFNKWASQDMQILIFNSPLSMYEILKEIKNTSP